MPRNRTLKTRGPGHVECNPREEKQSGDGGLRKQLCTAAEKSGYAGTGILAGSDHVENGFAKF